MSDMVVYGTDIRSIGRTLFILDGKKHQKADIFLVVFPVREMVLFARSAMLHMRCCYASQPYLSVCP